MWGLIKINPRQKIQYEPGYWKDRILHPREFHHPLTFVPIELRYGLSFTGGAGGYGQNMPTNWIKYDQDIGGNHYNAGKKIAKFGHQLDIDMLKLNLSNFILNTSWLDMNTGINYRYSNLFFPDTIPMNQWGNINPNWNLNRKFSPKLSEFSLSHALIFQWFEQFYLNMRYTWGIARSKFYLNSKSSDDNPIGWGPSTSYSIGLRYIFETEKNYRFAVGIDLKHSYVKIKNINDPKDVTPINRFDLQDYGIFLTIGAFYGGELSSGDNAKEYYYRGDFIESKKIFEQFINKNPTHSNIYRAKMYRQLSLKKIPYQLFKEGLQFENRGMIDKAVDRYMSSLQNADSALSFEVNNHLKKIASIRMQGAEVMISKGKYNEAKALLNKTVVFSKRTENEMPRFEALIMIGKGEAAMKYRFYDKALQLFKDASLTYPSLNRKINAYRFQIAAMMVNDIKDINDPAEIKLAIVSLEEAKKISGLGPVNEKIYQELKKRLSIIEDLSIRYGIDKRMEEERYRRIRLNSATIQIGMTIPEVMDIIGEPFEIVHEKDIHGKDAQLWFYNLNNDENLELSFFDYKLFRIE
jgi:tetratricopeptide (TPR) repeat protein